MPYALLKIVALAGAAAALGFTGVAATSGPDETDPGLVNSELRQRALEIKAWSHALEADPGSALALAQLAGLHLQRSRETGSELDVARAEDYARRSLAERANRNGKTYVTLASALIARHEFLEAEHIAELAVASDPDVPEYKALLADVRVELADYEGARPLFDSLAAYGSRLSIAPRLARWAELNGEIEKAHLLLEKAVGRAAARRDLPREQVAWFHFRLGDLEMRRGRFRRADAQFRAGLAVNPGDHRIHGAKARMALLQGKPGRAIQSGEQALAQNVEPRILWLLATAYLAAGDTVRARESAMAMDAASTAQAQHAAMQRMPPRKAGGMR